MERKKAGNFPQELLDLFDKYVHGGITRREFVDHCTRFAVGGVTGAALLESLAPNFAWALQVPKDDPRIKAEYAAFESPQGSGRMRGYLARPAKGGKAPGVVVIHENRGLNPYIEDVARRLATEGYVAFAPDALTPVGGYPGDEDKARAAFAKLDGAKLTEDLLAAYPFLREQPDVGARIGAIGFCFGGGMVNTMAARIPALAAAVPFYGPQPRPEEAARIKAPVQAHYAGNDERINAGIAAFEAALMGAGVKHEVHVYPNTNHGFHNDTTPRYDEAAAKLAWQRSLAWLKQHLA